MQKTIPNKYVTAEDISKFIEQNAQQNNGGVNLKEAFDVMRKDSPHIKVGYTKFENLAKEIMTSRGFTLASNKPTPKTPLLPQIPKSSSNSGLNSHANLSRSQTSEFPKQISPPSQDFDPVEPKYNFENIGGLLPQKQQLADLILLPLLHESLFRSAGATPIRGILLHGPSGCGKTVLAEAAAGQFAEHGLTFFKVPATDLLSPSKGNSGQSEGKIRALFRAASSLAPSLIFIDDIDSITSKKKDAASSKLINQLAQCMDQIFTDDEHHVIVLGTTSKVDSIDSSLRRPGRFGREISIGLPDFEQRFAVLNIHAAKLNLDDSVNLEEVAREAEGFVGADIVALVQEASLSAVKRAVDANEETAAVSMDDFMQSVKIVQPTLRREGFTTLPPASFADIGGLESVKKELQMAVVDAIIRPDIFSMYGHRPSSGVIMYGPPGCGKTLLARAIAHEANRAAFISIKGPELLNKYLGESESAIRAVFRRARDSAPSIIFFDELDAICPRRSDDSNNAAASRVVNQLLTEMDGVVDRGRVFVIGATNRLELIDEAMLRPGRLDKKIEVPRPDKNGRIDILSKKVARINNRDEIDVESIAERCEGFSGADLDALTSEAIEAAISESSENEWVKVGNRHYEAALTKLLNSVMHKKKKIEN
ncbi:AAA ATPase [Tritrichomonas foetus]|uniref:AAA ATPase n=1 Tax=Tritrichomonas foetus TaxID=1144522 RepID=A0A1J4JBX3_9EUKA|nr:AAA ATPase [Tritrichomonas foetus]|eukprot:OHS95155.1 AAA ATPase [Tritrichomonas foetus]